MGSLLTYFWLGIFLIYLLLPFGNAWSSFSPELFITSVWLHALYASSISNQMLFSLRPLSSGSRWYLRHTCVPAAYLLRTGSAGCRTTDTVSGKLRRGVLYLRRASGLSSLDARMTMSPRVSARTVPGHSHVSPRL